MPRSDYTAPNFVDVPNPASPPAGAVALDAAHVNAMAQAIANSARAVAFNVRDYGATGNGTTDDTAALRAAAAAAVAVSGTVLVPSGNYKVSGSITVGAGVSIVGDGFPTITATTTATVFTWQTPNGTLAPQGPHFRGLTFNARNAIQLNSVAGGFTDDSTTQNFIMRVYIADCQFNSDVNGSGTGVQLNKVFDWTITRCYFSNYATLLDLNGCDIGTVDTNRFHGGTIAQIRLTSYGTFGSQTTITRNDMLDMTSGCYILSSDYQLRVRDNYFENATNPIGAVVRATGGYCLYVTGNRVDVAASLCPNWLDVQVPLLVGEFIGNATTGSQYGPAQFPSGSATYWYSNGSARQRIRHGGNSNPAGMPFNSQESAPLGASSAFLWNPDLPGLRTDNYGLTARAAGGALLLPAQAGFGSLITIDASVTGVVSGYLVAKASTAGQILHYQQLDNGTAVNTSTLTLTASYARYPILTSGTVNNLSFRFWNDAADGAATVSIRSVEATF